MDLFGTAAPIAASKPPVNNMDLLGDLFGGGPSKPPVVSQQSSNLDDLFGTTTQAQKAYTCYTKNNLLITLTPTRIPSTTTCSIVASFSNSGSPISNLSFQVAVPKTLKLQMDPISSTTVSGNVETQVLKIENPGKEALRLKLKISYVFSGGNADDVVVFNGFDASLWQ